MVLKALKRCRGIIAEIAAVKEVALAAETTAAEVKKRKVDDQCEEGEEYVHHEVMSKTKVARVDSDSDSDSLPPARESRSRKLRAKTEGDDDDGSDREPVSCCSSNGYSSEERDDGVTGVDLEVRDFYLSVAEFDEISRFG